MPSARLRIMAAVSFMGTASERITAMHHRPSRPKTRPAGTSTVSVECALVE